MGVQKIIQHTLWMGTALTLGALVRSKFERSHLSVVHYRVETDKKIEGERRFVFLSDLHENSFGKNNRILVENIENLSPDAVLIGGDLPVVKKELCFLQTLNLLEQLTEKFPVYYANGNHELRMKRNRHKYGNAYCFFHRQLEEMGVIYLSDQKADFDQDIEIFGVDLDDRFFKRGKTTKMDGEYLRKKLGNCSKEKFSILLPHSPLYFGAYAEFGADLTLAGHFHGGTIRLPGNIGLMTPQYHFFSQYVVGLKQRGKQKMIISAGLGTHSVNLRLNNQPQLVVIDIVNTQQGQESKV